MYKPFNSYWNIMNKSILHGNNMLKSKEKKRMKVCVYIALAIIIAVAVFAVAVTSVK